MNKLIFLIILILILYSNSVDFTRTESDYPLYKNFNLNFKGKCGEIFKYPSNNEKDIVIFAYQSIEISKYQNIIRLIPKIIDSFKNSIPNAKLLCFVPKNSSNSDVVKILRYLNISIEIFEGYDDIHIVNSRFFIIKDFLIKNKNKYKRVFLSDLNDVFLLNDIFATFNETQLIINKECSYYKREKDCVKLFEYYDVKEWFFTFFGETSEITKKFIKLNPINLNAGIILGGTEKIIDLLVILTNNFEKEKLKYFGYDQTILNKLYYNDELKSLNLTIEGCTQRICFRPKNLRFNKATTKIYFLRNHCSPIIIHKYFPSSWERSKENIINVTEILGKEEL